MDNPIYIDPFSVKDNPATLASQFLSSLQYPQEVQAHTLFDILHRSSDSETGKHFGFSSIHSVEQYQNTLPLSEWKDYAPTIQLLSHGEENILFSGKTVQFLQTSGTNGHNKWIPMSKTSLSISSLVTCIRSYFRRQSIVDSGLIDTNEQTDTNRIFLFPSPAHIGYSPGNIPVGYASGLTSRQTVGTLKKMHFTMPDSNINALVEKEELLFYQALSCPHVVAAIGNNPRRFLALWQKAESQADKWIHALKTGELPNSMSLQQNLPLYLERSHALQSLHQQGKFLPRHYWPHLNLACFWLSGPMAPAIEAMRPLVPSQTIFFDAGYGASELKINIPLKPGTPFAPPALFAGFFEFIPQQGGPPVLLHELQDNHIYEPVLTTYAGLYRYRLGDWIQVCKKTKATPNLAFYGRVQEAANLSGEKVDSAVLLRAAQKASTEQNVTLCGFALYPNPHSAHYECYVELDTVQGLPSAWAHSFDMNLQGMSTSYARRRQDGSLSPPKAMQMHSGWENERLQTTQSGQAKSPLLLLSPPNQQLYI